MSGRGQLSPEAKMCAEGETKWIPLSLSYRAVPLQTTPISAAGTMFLYVPTARLISMSVLSVGIYQTYWVYKNWRYLCDRDRLAIMPFWRGIFSVFFFYSLLKTIKNDPVTSRIRQAVYSPGLLATGWVAAVVMARACGRVPELFVVALAFQTLSVCFLLPVHFHIQALNDSSSARNDYVGWTVGHIVCAVFGAIAWVFIFLGIAVKISES